MTETQEQAAAIEVGENGPYHVTGGVPLVRVSKVESDQGEPIAWRIDETIDAPATYELCRCGNCTNKPFANEEGCFDFDGSEAAPTDLYADRSKALGGTSVMIVDDRSICSHAGFCANRVTNAWKAAKRIDDDPELREQIVGMVDLCPSGALTVEVGGSRREPALPIQIAVESNGPLRVTGGIPIRRADGEPFETRHRVSLCRCGHSKNKPLCDGTHKEIGFTG